jgi:uncharacterized membrane protein YjjP (DUF1212 family)
MVKHKRWSDKPKSDTPSIDEEKNVAEQETSIQKESKDIKSLIVSGTKYIYIIVAAALLSGIFTPLTIGEDLDQVIYGMLSIFLGLGGGIAIYLATKNQKFTIVMVSGGLAMMFASLVLIYEFAFHSLF